MTDDSIITNTILPELAQSGAFERIADIARIVKPGHAIMHKSHDAPGQISQFLQAMRNVVGQTKDTEDMITPGVQIMRYKYCSCQAEMQKKRAAEAARFLVAIPVATGLYRQAIRRCA